jgi:hypothetical protein
MMTKRLESDSRAATRPGNRAHERFARNLVFIISISIILLSMTRALTQSAVSGNATDFTSEEYYPPPDESQVKLQLSGAQANPLPGGLLVIKQFKLQMFNTNGETQVTVNAPECTYDTVHGLAYSPGPLSLQNGDGKIHMQGTGFLWRQADSFLIVSNQRTTIENGMVAPVAGKRN